MTLPNPASAIFKINGSQVTGWEYQDNRTLHRPGTPTSNRVEYFPGSQRPFVQKGRVRKGQVVATGFLRAASAAALWTLVELWENFFDATTTCALTVHSKSYSSAAPMRFELLEERLTAFRDEDAPFGGVRILVRFIFQIL